MPPLPLSGRDLTIDNVIEVARGTTSRRARARGSPADGRFARRHRAARRRRRDRVRRHDRLRRPRRRPDRAIADGRAAAEPGPVARGRGRRSAAGRGGARHARAARQHARGRALRRPRRGGRAADRHAEPAVHPVVPSRGSLGASGDLAPLAHLALVLIGEGEATVDGAGSRRGRRRTGSRRADAADVAREGGPGPAQRHPADGRARGAGDTTTRCDWRSRPTSSAP